MEKNTVTPDDPEKNLRFYLVSAVTLVRVPAAAAFAAVFLSLDGPGVACGIAVGLVAAVELSDLLDGTLARRLDVVSEAGAAMDPWADSISRLTVYWALAAGGAVIAVVPLVMAVRDVTVAYCRIALARRGRSVTSLWSGKIKAAVQGAGALAAAAQPFYADYTGPWPLAAVSWTVIAVTAVSAAEYVAVSLGRRRGNLPSSQGE